MGYLNLLQRTCSASAASNATVSGEQNNISVKWRGQLRNMIDFLTNGQGFSALFIHASGTRKLALNIARGASTYDIEARVVDSVLITGRTITELSLDTDYILYYAESNTSQAGVYAFFGIYDTAGTLVASATRGYSVAPFPSGGEIAVNYQTGQDRTTGRVDGVAVYTGANARKTGADRYNAPTAGDPGLASGWLFTETSGNTAANLKDGAESLSITGTENTAFEWASGGAWPQANATLSSPTPAGTIATETTATIGATTNQNTGTLYVVVDTAANLAGVTAAQVKAGQKANSTAALASGSATVSSTTPSASVSGLTKNTLYSYAAVQNNANGDSNVVTETFTTYVFGASEGPGLVIGDEAGFVGEGAVGAPNVLPPGTYVTAGFDALVVTEYAATVNKARAIAAALDTLVITERVATTKLSRSVAAGTDALAITEQAATLRFSKAIAANFDALVISEQAAVVKLSRSIAAGLDALVINELAATVGTAAGINAGVDALVVAEQPATVNKARAIAASADTLSIAEQPAAVKVSKSVAAGTDALAITERTATVQRNKTVAASFDALAIAEQTATVRLAKAIAAAVDQLVITERQAAVSTGSAISATVDALVITERQATMRLQVAIAAGFDQLSVTERQAAVRLSKLVAAGVDALLVTERQALLSLAKVVLAGFDELTITEQQAIVEGQAAILELVAARIVQVATRRAELRVERRADTVSVAPRSTPRTIH